MCASDVVVEPVQSLVEIVCWSFILEAEVEAIS